MHNEINKIDKMKNKKNQKKNQKKIYIKIEKRQRSGWRGKKGCGIL